MLAAATGLEAAALPLMVFAPSGVQWMQGAYKILDGELRCWFVDGPVLLPAALRPDARGRERHAVVPSRACSLPLLRLVHAAF